MRAGRLPPQKRDSGAIIFAVEANGERIRFAGSRRDLPSSVGERAASPGKLAASPTEPEMCNYPRRSLVRAECPQPLRLAALRCSSILRIKENNCAAFP
jgi:hypothetical protein